MTTPIVKGLLAFTFCLLLVSCQNDDTGDLTVQLQYASTEPASNVDVQLFENQEDFTNRNQDAALVQKSNENGEAEFNDLEPGNYWVWALIGSRSDGGQLMVQPGENLVELELR